MRDLYFSGGQTMQGKLDPKNVRLFQLYLKSDNFYDDAVELMRDSFAGLDNKEIVILLKYLAPPTMLVNRRGKNMHRVRAQLEALENDGQEKMAEMIRNFIMEEYRKKSNVSKIIDLWSAIMITYEGFIKNKSISDVNMLISKFAQEMKRINDLARFSVHGVTLLMDAYTLARMFRKYSGKKHVDSVKTIVYAGDTHVSTYVKFFNEILNTNFIAYNPNKLNIETENHEKIKRCLNVNLKDFSL